MKRTPRFSAIVVAMAVMFLPLATLAAEPLPAGPASAALQGLDAFIEAEMAKEKVPGLAIAVVKDGKVIYQRGFGYRDMARKLPVTTATAFPIASVTKSFTVLTLGSLVEQGKLDWDRPVRGYVADFKLYDPTATEHMTARDLVSHRSGLPRHDNVWFGATVTRRHLWESLRYLQPNADFRERFQYNNLMFVAAGYLAGELAGRPWESLVEQQVFVPLGMTGSSTSIRELGESAEPALGYVAGDKDEMVKRDYANIDAIAPAGAINSTLADMTRYLQLHLGDGKVDGREIFDAALLQEMRLPQISDRKAPKYPEFGGEQYGMGLFVDSYRGYRHIHHGGNITGFTSELSYLPEQKIGVVMLSNRGSSRLRDIVPYRIYDRLLGLSEIDWSGRLAARKASDKAAEAKSEGKVEKKVPTLKRAGTRPAHALADYTGDYAHPAYGVIRIGGSARGLTMGFHGSEAALRHYHYEVFETPDETPEDKLNPLQGQRLQFHTNADGDIVSVGAEMESTVAAIVFERRAAPRMSERSFLAPMAGTYVAGSDEVVVKLRDDGVLVVTTEGTSSVLLPVSGTRFKVEGQERHGVEFVKGESGRFDSLVQYRPWGNRFATRR